MEYVLLRTSHSVPSSVCAKSRSVPKDRINAVTGGDRRMKARMAMIGTAMMKTRKHVINTFI